MTTITIELVSQGADRCADSYTPKTGCTPPPTPPCNGGPFQANPDGTATCMTATPSPPPLAVTGGVGIHPAIIVAAAVVLYLGIVLAMYSYRYRKDRQK